MRIRGVSKFSVVLLTGALLLLNGCASTQYVESERDPWQGFNRAMYGFNDGLDRAILKPAAQGYRAVAPDFVETGVRNFFENLDDISVAVNNLLQGKVANSASDIGRVVINSTIGVLGLFDVASSMGFTKHEIQQEPLSLRERMTQVLSSLAVDDFIEFSSLFTKEEGRDGVIVTFIAILELLKDRVIEIVQSEMFAPIYVKPASQATEKTPL